MTITDNRIIIYNKFKFQEVLLESIMFYFDFYCSFVVTILLTLLTQFKFALSTQKIEEVKHEDISSLIEKQNHRIQLNELRNVGRDKEMNFLEMEKYEIRK